ncbi:sugar phosphate isomerase/epimerase [candidate division KSB1 bacterium]|nr:sugar phosphate isomerase/epimerase [candidate division KSB1 bacterium]
MPVRVGLTIQKYHGIEASIMLSLARRFGLEYVEITKDVFSELEKIVKLVKHLRVGFHLPIICDDGWDFSCVNSPKSIDNLIGQINQHWKSLNIRYFLTHPPEPKESRAQLETSASYLLENLQRLPGYIFLENVPTWGKAEFWDFYVQAKKVLGKQLSGICLDAPHYYIMHHDPIEQIQFWKEKIKCVHLSDCIRGHDLHLPFGSGGDLPIDAILTALKDINYNQYINLELLPKTFNDLPYLTYSYLKVLKKFRPAKYYRSKIQTLIILPLIQRILNRLGGSKTR